MFAWGVRNAILGNDRGREWRGSCFPLPLSLVLYLLACRAMVYLLGRPDCVRYMVP